MSVWEIINDKIKKKSLQKSRMNVSPRDGSNLFDFAPDEDNETKYDYCEEITSQIAKDSVYNIALEGDYGTGKSSIIKKLVSSYKKNRVKTISFLSFNPEKLTRRKDEGASDDNEESLNKEHDKIRISDAIQTEIVRQLFYGEKSEKAAWGGYHRLGRRYFWMSVIIAAIISFLLLDKFYGVKKLYYAVVNDWLQLHVIVAIIITLVTFAMLCYISSRIIKKIQKSRIKNVSTSDINVELYDDKADFDQLLDYLILFFKHTEYTLVIFEDLDRFGEVEIFEELRQLNFELNQSKDIKRKISFLYAVNANLFKDAGQRTKIFDAIIPVTPFYSAVTAEAFMRTMLIRAIEKDKQDYIVGTVLNVSNEIENVRVLKDIINNISIYEKIYNTNDEKVIKNYTSLSIIKVLCPDEFTKMLTSSSYIDQRIAECKKNRDQSEKEIREEYSIVNILDENKEIILHSLYASSFGGNSGHQYYGAESIEMDGILVDGDKFDISRLLNAGSVTVYWKNNGAVTYKKDIIEKTLGILPEYTEYKDGKLVEKMNLKREELLRQPLLKSEREEKLNNNDEKVINKLIESNSFDENIVNYLTESNDGIEVEKFIYRCIRCNSPDATYKTDAFAKEIMERLTITDMYSVGVYNYNLVNYISSKKYSDQIKEKYETFIDNIKNRKELFFAFYESYFYEITKNSPSDSAKYMYVATNVTNIGYHELFMDIIKKYPEIIVKLSARIMRTYPQTGSCMLNLALRKDIDLKELKLERDELENLRMFAGLIERENVEIFLKILLANNVSVYKLEDLKTDDKDRLLLIMLRDGNLIDQTVENFRYMGAKRGLQYLCSGKLKQNEINIEVLVNCGREYIEYFSKSEQFIEGNMDSVEAIELLCRKAIKAKIVFENAILKKYSTVVSKQTVIKMIIFYKPDNETIREMLVNTKDAELKKISDHGDIRIDKNKDNIVFAKLLQDRGLIKITHRQAGDKIWMRVLPH